MSDELNPYPGNLKHHKVDAAPMKHYTRFELIGPTGRITVHYGKVEADEQDGGRTLKVFIDRECGGQADPQGPEAKFSTDED